MRGKQSEGGLEGSPGKAEVRSWESDVAESRRRGPAVKNPNEGADLLAVSIWGRRSKANERIFLFCPCLKDEEPLLFGFGDLVSKKFDFKLLPNFSCQQQGKPQWPLLS